MIFPAVFWLAATAAAAGEVQLFVATPLPKAAQVALEELREAVASHGVVVRDAAAPPKPETAAILVGTSRGTETFDRLLGDAKIEVPDLPESSAVAWIEGRRQTLVIAGSDERGLTYALRDAARGITLAPHAPTGGDWTKGVTPAVESPFLRVRNVSLHLFNADCEREWFFSEEFWRFYFARLSLSRFNRCTLTFCDQTNYLCPPYAYLVAMPEYPQVRMEDCTPEQREANLAMLRRITELADEYAIDFDLGIWMQAPVSKWAAPVKVSGLPEGLALADYCALGLRRIYEGCPSLDGIQLRMNAEAGVSEEQQTAFYKPLFQALAATGRPLRVELRYKGLQQATIDAAVAAGLDVTVSTKFWAEHFGLPYHPTVVDSHYAQDRYSFGTLLKRPRNYRVTYQLWTVGSQRVTLWGDPEYAARFAKSCTLGGGEGFEVFAPLTNKGYGNAPGAWPVIKNPEYRVGRWEQERYWIFYLCFGRLGYNPATNPETWKREFRHRFGEAAEQVEEAYKAASQVLPLITAALLPSASEWSWWPELDTGGNLAEYARIQTSDPSQFAAVRQWEKTPDWRWEDWDQVPGFLENLAMRSYGRTTPLMTAHQLKLLEQSIRNSISEWAETSPDSHAERRITEVDLQLLGGLACFHAEKLEAAVHQAFYEAGQNKHQLHASFAHLSRAHRKWKDIVESTDGVYHDRLVFGVSPENTRNKFGHHHSGHWRDRLPEIEAEVQRLQDAAKRLGPFNVQTVREAENELFNLSRSGSIPVDFLPRHTAAESFGPNRPLTLELTLGGKEMPARITAYVRPLDQTRPWRQFTLLEMKANTYAVTLPAEAVDSHYDVQYYFRLFDGQTSRLWPDWRTEQPYFVVPVENQKR